MSRRWNEVKEMVGSGIEVEIGWCNPSFYVFQEHKWWKLSYCGASALPWKATGW